METTTDDADAQQIEAAAAALDTERGRLDVERAAFTQFRKRIAAMDVHAPSPHTTARVTNAVMGTSTAAVSSTQPKQVREAYRETVMSVPHYEEDYGQPLDADLAEEFGPELANALATTDSFTPPLQGMLLAGSTRASESRTALLDALNREADNLHETATALEEMNTALNELNQRPIAAWSRQDLTTSHERLREFKAHCDELAAERQADLHSQRIRGPKHTDEELNEYLYESLPVTYPVLADIAEFTSLLCTARQRLERALITR